MYAIAIHGGAGVIRKEGFSEDQQSTYQNALKIALNCGYEILEKKGKALDAVENTVACMEDNELFNAGRGSVFTADSTHEMEASIMCGERLDAGAVTGIKNVKNPIVLARLVLEKSNHLFLSGDGAEKFAKEMELRFEDDSYFFTQKRYDQLQQALRASRMQLDHHEDEKIGTVGAVALDSNGNLAAATSTGGLTSKKYGRIGDSPIIGAGTYANNKHCAVSCTGYGEFFMRAVLAYDIYCLMDYMNLTLKEACEKAVKEKLKNLGGEGGVIAIDVLGNIEMVFISEGMYRASRKEGEETQVMIW